MLVIVAAAGAWYWRWRGSHAKAPVEFETATVDRGRIVSRVTATGTVSALVTVQVGSQVSGRIQKLFVDFNSPVKKGQLIATIDPQLFAAAVEQNQANTLAAMGNVAKAEAQQRDAQRQFERARGLLERKLIAQADFDTAEANLEVTKGQAAAARGAVAQAKAGLHQAKVNLDFTRIVSPTDGVVISRSVDVGQTVAAAMQAPTLFVIAQDLRKMQVDTSVSEADIGKLQPGMPTTFTVDAYPGTRFRGKIRQIRNAAQTLQNVVTYDAVIDVDNNDLKLRPGMTANVTFVWAEKDDVLRAPNAALRFRPSSEILTALGMTPLGAPGGGAGGQGASASGSVQGRRAADPSAPSGGPSRARDEAPDRRAAWLLRAGRPQSVQVRTGISDGSLTEIVDGELHQGDLVVVDATVVGQPSAPAAGGTPPGSPGGMRRMF